MQINANATNQQCLIRQLMDRYINVLWVSSKALFHLKTSFSSVVWPTDESERLEAPCCSRRKRCLFQLVKFCQWYKSHNSVSDIANPDKLKTRMGRLHVPTSPINLLRWQKQASVGGSGSTEYYYHELAVEQDWTSMWWPCACCLSLFQQQQPARGSLLTVLLWLWQHSLTY